MPRASLQVQQGITVLAPPERVLEAFFNPVDLQKWWRASRSVTVPRPLGTYAIEWPNSSFRDELLGFLGGAFHGTVMEYRPGREFFLADAYWNPPTGDPIGPMALEVRCSVESNAPGTYVTVRLSGEDDGPRWQRYFQVVATGWQRALADLKQYLESERKR